MILNLMYLSFECGWFLFFTGENRNINMEENITSNITICFKSNLITNLDNNIVDTNIEFVSIKHFRYELA